MTDRAREGLFSSLGDVVVDANVLDLYAGSGSLGLEALSRGASHATFVEQNHQALAALRQNVAATDLSATIVAADVRSALRSLDSLFDLVFVDPPYDLALPSVVEVIVGIVHSLQDRGIVIVHRRRGGEPPVVAGMRETDCRTYGDTELFRLMKEDR